jgi:class 3 adenylate cyclase
MRVGIGIHSRVLVSCNLGGQKRRQYTTIGDTTNTAARVMAVTKQRLRQSPAVEQRGIIVSNPAITSSSGREQPT